MRTYEELNEMHDLIMKTLFREKDTNRMKLQSAELDMLAFFRKFGKADSFVREHRDKMLTTTMGDPITNARINMCNWFLKEG